MKELCSSQVVIYQLQSSFFFFFPSACQISPPHFALPEQVLDEGIRSITFLFNCVFNSGQFEKLSLFISTTVLFYLFSSTP